MLYLVGSLADVIPYLGEIFCDKSDGFMFLTGRSQICTFLVCFREKSKGSGDVTILFIFIKSFPVISLFWYCLIPI